LEYKCDYIALADDATEQVALAYDDFGRCICEYALAKDKLLSIKLLIEIRRIK
jgi:YD repeat-containing protein